MMRYYRLTSFLVSNSARLRRLYSHHFTILDQSSQGQWFYFLSQVLLAFFLDSISLFYSIKLLSRLFSILSIFLSIFFYQLILLTCFWLRQQNCSNFCIGVELSIYLAYLGICSYGSKNSGGIYKFIRIIIKNSLQKYGVSLFLFGYFSQLTYKKNRVLNYHWIISKISLYFQ